MEMVDERMMQKLLEWVSLLRRFHREEKEICLFVEDDGNDLPPDYGIPEGFDSAEEVGKKRIKYLDGKLPENIYNTAFHVGYVNELDYGSLSIAATLYTPIFVGYSEDGYAVIVGKFRNKSLPVASNIYYSPEQQARLWGWLLLTAFIDIDQYFIIMHDGGEGNKLFETREEITSADFLDEFGDIRTEIVKESLFLGEISNLTADVLDMLTYKKISGLFCSIDGILVLLCSDESD